MIVVKLRYGLPSKTTYIFKSGLELQAFLNVCYRNRISFPQGVDVEDD